LSVIVTLGMTFGLAFVSLAGACGPIITRNVGEKCWLDYECTDPLKCVANACHHLCSTTNDCADKAACITIQDRAVCRLANDCADSQDCPSGNACVANRCGSSSGDAGDSGQEHDPEAGSADAADAGSPDALEADSNDGALCDAAEATPFDFKPSNFSP